MQTFQFVFDFFISFIENYFIILLLEIYLSAKKENALLVSFLITIISTFINNYFYPPIFCFIFLLVLLYIYTFTCLNGSKKYKIMIPFIIFSNVFFIDVSILIVCEIIGLELSSFMGVMGPAYFMISIFQKIILGIEYVFIKIYSKQKIYIAKSIIVLSIFFIFISMLVPEIILTQYLKGIIKSDALLVSSFVQFIMSYIILYKIFMKMNQEHTKYINQQILFESRKSEEKLLTLIQEKIDEVNRLNHDLNNHKLVISKMIDNQACQQVKEYTQDVFFTDFYVSTNNQVLNYILNDKLKRAKNLGIDVKCVIEGDFENTISLVDLSIVIGNLLDNAIEATIQADHRYIKMNIKQDKNNLMITVTNTYNGVVQRINDTFLTSKSNHQKHGYGISSIKLICQKYDGESFITYNDTYFYHKCIFVV